MAVFELSFNFIMCNLLIYLIKYYIQLGSTISTLPLKVSSLRYIVAVLLTVILCHKQGILVANTKKQLGQLDSAAIPYSCISLSPKDSTQAL